MKMFFSNKQESDNAFVSNCKMAVKNSGLTFNAQGRRLILQKINAMRKLFAVIAASTIFLSCNKTVIHGEGNVVSAERNVSYFSGIEISGSNNIFISYAPEVSVSISGYDNLVSHYVTEVRDDKLSLHYDENTNVRNDNVQV